MAEIFADNSLFPLILVLAAVTFATRAGGYFVLSQFKHIHPRVEAALQAVPAAVLSTLVFPAAITKGWLEGLTMLIALLACYKLPPIFVLVLGLAFLSAGRLIVG